MRTLLTVLLKGFPGHPLHPPLTDATIGAFTVGSIAMVLAWIGLWPDVLVGAAFTALVIGVVLAVPTGITGFVDYRDLARGEPARKTALLHLGVMVTAVVLFLLALLILGAAGLDAGVPVGAGLFSILALAVLALGGWLGGGLVYVNGVRVVGDRSSSTKATTLPRLPAPGERMSEE